MEKPFYSESLAKLILRIAVGGLMLPHGIHKIRNGLGWIEGQLVGAGLPEGLAYGVYLGEVVAPILILLGFLTRPCALILAGTMVMAIYLAHRTEIFAVNANGGLETELPLMYLAGALALFFFGGGRFSVSGGEGKWN